MVASVRIVDRGPSPVQTAIENTKARPKQSDSSLSPARKRDSLIYKLTRLVLPPIRVKRMEPGNLYIRKRGDKKEFVRIRKAHTKGCLKMNNEEQFITQKEAELRQKLKSLHEEREKALECEGRHESEGSDLTCRQTGLLKRRSELYEERARTEERERQERIGHRTPQPYERQSARRSSRPTSLSTYEEANNTLSYHCDRSTLAPCRSHRCPDSSDSDNSNDLEELYIVRRRRSLIHKNLPHDPIRRERDQRSSVSCIGNCQHEHRPIQHCDHGHRHHCHCGGKGVLTKSSQRDIRRGRHRSSSYVRVETRHPADYSSPPYRVIAK